MHNKALIHKEEHIRTLDGESETLFGLELVDDLVVVNILVPWISLNDVALPILLGDVVHEIPFVDDHFDGLVSHLTQDVILIFVAAVLFFLVCVLSLEVPVGYLQH